jgi:hypothetical protein
MTGWTKTTRLMSLGHVVADKTTYLATYMYVRTDVNLFFNSDSWRVVFALPHAYTDRAVVAYKHTRGNGGVQPS